MASTSDLEELLGLYNKHKRASDFDVLTCTWNDVLEQMQIAQRRYEQKGQTNIIRGLFRHGKSAKTILSPLLAVIPEDYGLNALKGGLGLIFNCLAQRQEVVENIFLSFKHIPLIMENAEETLKIFYEDKKLGDYVWRLYDALLTGVPLLVGILLHRSDEKGWKKVLRNIPSRQDDSIKEILSTIDIAKQRLLDYAENLGYRTTAKTEQLAAKTLEGVTELKLDVGELSRTTTQGLNHVMRAMLNIHKRMDELGDDQERMISMIAELSQPNLYIQAVQTALYHLGQEFFFQRKLLPAPSSRPSRRRPLGHISSRSSHIAVLLRLLGTRPQGPEDHLHAGLDLMAVLRKNYDFDDDSIGQSRWLLTSPRFREWLTLPESAALVVHSYGTAAVDGRASAMSVLAATLTSALLRQGTLDVVPLHFFCGLHAAEEDGFSGPVGIIRSLAMQLLLSQAIPEPDLDLTSSPGLVEDLEDGVPDAFMHVLEQLVIQLPPGKRLYCLLDAPGVYDTRRNGWEEELRLALRLLNRLVYSRSLAPIFKLLITTPFRSDVILEGLTPDDTSGYPSPFMDLTAGQIDRRPLTEEAILADMVRFEDDDVVSAGR